MNNKQRKLKVLNKHFCLQTDEHGRRIMVPNPFELAKQWCMLSAKKGLAELPYTAYSVYEYEDDYPDLIAWMDALTYQNPPSKVSFYQRPQDFRQLVEPLDFSKPYDRDVVAAIHARFTIGAVSDDRPDASDIINAQLFEE